jgi:hypothetical protein
MIASITAVIDVDPPGDTSVASPDHTSIPRPIAMFVRLIATFVRLIAT